MSIIIIIIIVVLFPEIFSSCLSGLFVKLFVISHKGKKKILNLVFLKPTSADNGFYIYIDIR